MTEEQAIKRIAQAIKTRAKPNSGDYHTAKAAWNEIKAIMKEDAEQRRQNGKKAGGIARAKKLTPARRTEIARKAAQARWS